MKTTNQTPRCARTSRSFLRCSAFFLLGVALVAAQSQITRPQSQTSRAAPTKHVATLRSSDSPGGSRVTLTADLSLNNYEAYRRGDRFYVRIPATEIPRAETVRGRGFADVKVQRSGDSVIISFRLQPGGTAHVEQRGNRLEIVFTLPGERESGASSSRNSSRPDAVTDANRRSSSPKSATNQTGSVKGSPAGANKNPGTRASASDPSLNASTNSARGNSGSAKTGAPLAIEKTGSKPGDPLAASPTPGLKSLATPAQSPSPSPVAKPSSTPLAQTGSATPASSPARQTTPAVATSDRPSTGAGSLKERLRYWILLAQLNPVPVAIGLGLFILLIILLLFQRRRAKGTRRPSADESAPARSVVESASVTTPVKTAESAVTTPVVAAAAAGTLAATPLKRDAEPEPAAVTGGSQSGDDARRQLVTRVAAEAKNATAGGDYDAALIGSNDRETRQLVGAELLAALVSRNPDRRERAKDLFMKHGYFDDATRDLRVAESPNERAAAARRLSFVHDPEATPHLIGALQDSSPDVRRAAVEALMDARDPAAIAPLNALMQTENDRKVPRNLIKHAIDACATSAPPSDAPEKASPSLPTVAPPHAPTLEPEREVIEL
jgi:HEAT repeats